MMYLTLNFWAGLGFYLDLCVRCLVHLLYICENSMKGDHNFFHLFFFTYTVVMYHPWKMYKATV